MLRHRALYGDNCGVLWVLRTTWCSRNAAHPKEEYRQFALINQRWSSNLGFGNLAKLQNSSVDFLVLRENVVLCWKVISKAALSRQTPFLHARCATANNQHVLTRRWSLLRCRGDYWIALQYTPTTAWIWPGNKSPIFTNWGTGNRDTNASCAAISTKGVWKALPCNKQLPYICYGNCEYLPA